MISDRELAYEKCFRPVAHYYCPSEAPGLRKGTEKLVAMIIAWEADESGVLLEWDTERLADLCRLSPRTFRRYVSVLFDTGWLIDQTAEAGTRICIDPQWLQSLPPVPSNPYNSPRR
ncbi:hypothetical protein WG922_17445 [Ramlibacter sp. AN1015]|uniref:hypothetical protein n=1 Tax=Ramlibacter sp. AN1015 TaxID=3133428 RepID=UPI0030BC41F6